MDIIELQDQYENAKDALKADFLGTINGMIPKLAGWDIKADYEDCDLNFYAWCNQVSMDGIHLKPVRCHDGHMLDVVCNGGYCEEDVEMIDGFLNDWFMNL